MVDWQGNQLQAGAPAIGGSVLQNCHFLVPQHWKLPPFLYRHCAPGFRPQAPHWQLLLQTLAAQGSPQLVDSEPGAHTPWLPQVPQDGHAFHWHDELQVRVRLCVPQLPQPWLWLSDAPAAQTPWPPQVPQDDHAPHPQLAVHVRVRVWVPQLPQPWLWVSTWPGVHTGLLTELPQTPVLALQTPGPQALLSALQSLAVPEHLPLAQVSL